MTDDYAEWERLKAKKEWGEILEKYISAPWSEHERICLEIIRSDVDEDTKIIAAQLREVLLQGVSVRRDQR